MVTVTSGAPCHVQALRSGLACAGCEPESLLNRIGRASRTPHASYVATPAASWLDDFLTWISPDIPQCCRMYVNGTRCPPPDQAPCDADPAACAGCMPCFAPADLDHGRPSTEQVRSASLPACCAVILEMARLCGLLCVMLSHGHRAGASGMLLMHACTAVQLEAKLPWFLESAPSASCAKGGLGAYDDVFQRDAETHGRVAGLDEGVVAASTFRTNYVTLSSQADFINAMQVGQGCGTCFSAYMHFVAVCIGEIKVYQAGQLVIV